MFDHDKSMHRGALRQHQTEEIMKGICALEDDVPREKVEIYLPIVIHAYLINMPAIVSAVIETNDPHILNVVNFFGQDVLSAVREFAPREEEQRVILADVLQRVIASAMSPISTIFLTLESTDQDNAYPDPTE
jgi:hypothetical protein